MKNNTKFEEKPTIKINTKELFGFDCSFDIFGFANKNDFVPNIEKSYKFDPTTTRAILAGFAVNRKVLITGYHGTGKTNPY